MVFPYGFRDCVHIPPENIPTRQLQGALNVMAGSDDGEKSYQEMVTAGGKVQYGEWNKDLGGLQWAFSNHQAPIHKLQRCMVAGCSTHHSIRFGARLHESYFSKVLKRETSSKLCCQL